MSGKAHSAADFSLSQARGIVKDLFTPVPAIYWADFLLSTAVGMVCFSLVRRVLTPWSIQQAIAFVICGVAFYRSVLFTHELVHLRDNTFRGFSIVWNLLCGIPFLMPSFTYYTHLEHHTRRLFGTHNDGEYLPLGTQAPWHIAAYLTQPLWLPLAAVLRFALFTPLSWISPRFRDFVHRRMSSMVMDPSYIRPLPTRKVLRIYRLQEALCFLWVVGVAVAITSGRVPIAFLAMAYCVSVFILSMNNLRTLGAHRYTNEGEEMNFVNQMLDSVNYPHHAVFAEMVMPVGLRYHGLHHVFPSLPYHNLGKAHARLMERLPADSPYRQTVSPSLTASLLRLYRAARTASEKTRATETSARRQPSSVGRGMTQLR